MTENGSGVYILRRGMTRPAIEDDRNAFTLIELLIVVAIIGILSAIALPNFLNARAKSQVARMQADMTSVRTALEMYFIDHATYPPGPPPAPPFGEVRTYLLTTPLAYISQIPLDIFNPGPAPDPPGGPFAIPGPYIGYLCDDEYGQLDHNWLLMTFGPDLTGPDYDVDEQGNFGPVHYDPTNGIVSSGDIYFTAASK